MSVPSFHYLEPLNQLPGSEINTLLGRFVLDRWNPGVQGFEPEDPSRVITEEYISEDIHFENAEMRIASISHKSAQASLSRAVMLGNSHNGEGDVVLRSAKVIKRAIKDARVAFTALLNDLEVSEGVKKMMRSSRKHTVWMITGILCATDAHIGTITSTSNLSGMKTTIPIPSLESTGLSLTTLGTGGGTLSSSRRVVSHLNLEADISGSRIFAVQYWRCELRPMDRLFDRWRNQMVLQGKGVQRVSTGHRGLGNYGDDDGSSDDDDPDAHTLVISGEEILDPRNDPESNKERPVVTKTA
ncbi:hypothetical protein PMG11_09547 [Penicillium brasilianum]|uniref:Uncharacterized protein n=1 Tax=Penicillium brasilianum TaxID=104259 RepID=A0A0F7U158_PENBI|nr:hypothetical protein PMG11_09547 [Penicillium brasilianum]